MYAKYGLHVLPHKEPTRIVFSKQCIVYRMYECFAVPVYLQPYASSCQVYVQYVIYLYTEPLRPQSGVEVIGQEDNDYYTVATYMQGLISGSSQAFPIFHCSFTSVYYTECKPMNKKTGDLQEQG